MQNFCKSNENKITKIKSQRDQKGGGRVEALRCNYHDQKTNIFVMKVYKNWFKKLRLE